ncbi:MAG: hypothetical protein IJZ67_08565 [Alistipes sp.]|nr:hypothetical protein [Alistipes sp.]
MIKKTLSILLLIATVVAVIFAAINSSKSQSLLMQYIEQTDKKDIEPSETVNPCDSIPCDSLCTD